ncbi:aromatic acid exporter family protein [Lysinibacillus telephonicus]|uniref:Aromatic acid exporter family protein n=1 Tax=Lysinibacillus telephonicus TaxID=1714840 RepID=A0A3S0HMY4_9BACI|nr:aromatic acid exporter family protein [Lysinibacillus telephonicus]RTQ93472.1 aromatic acid exporter family protein [Lysinibacillus telephonicus]
MKKFKIGYRTIKTAVGAGLAIVIAEYFNLQFFSSAAILTILCVQTTKKKSLHAVYTRLVASIIGMAFSFIALEFFGYNPLVLALMILVFIPTIVSLGVAAGFVSSVVIIMHIYSEANFTYDLLLNELGLMAIGFGTALAVNMYMGDFQKEMDQYLEQIEELYRSIFSEIVKYLRNGDASWDGKEIILAAELLNKAKSLAYKDVENHFTRKENLYYLYFDMREKQLEIIERVLPKITTLPVMVQQASLVADFMQELSENVHSGNTAKHFREKLETVKEVFAKMPLPETHEKFLAMASLYQFIEEMDEYLMIKQSFKGLKSKDKKKKITDKL